MDNADGKHGQISNLIRHVSYIIERTETTGTRSRRRNSVGGRCKKQQSIEHRTNSWVGAIGNRGTALVHEISAMEGEEVWERPQGDDSNIDGKNNMENNDSLRSASQRLDQSSEPAKSSWALLVSCVGSGLFPSVGIGGETHLCQLLSTSGLALLLREQFMARNEVVFGWTCWVPHQRCAGRERGKSRLGVRSTGTRGEHWQGFGSTLVVRSGRDYSRGCRSLEPATI
jgi:hypothetical protein